MTLLPQVEMIVYSGGENYRGSIQHLDKITMALVDVQTTLATSLLARSRKNATECMGFEFSLMLFHQSLNRSGVLVAKQVVHHGCVGCVFPHTILLALFSSKKNLE